MEIFLLQYMMAYHWPGNIRKLEHIIERDILLSKCNIIETDNLPRQIKTGVTMRIG